MKWLRMTSYLSYILIIFVKLISGAREIPWPIYCQTVSGEYCGIEVKPRKLLCLSSCNDVTEEEEDRNSHLIVDWTVESRNIQHSRTKREISALDAFVTALFSELIRLFIVNFVR